VCESGEPSQKSSLCTLSTAVARLQCLRRVSTTPGNTGNLLDFVDAPGDLMLLATAGDLLGAFTSALSAHNLNMKKMLQVAMDGPNVNLMFLTELKRFLKNSEDQEDPELLDIGTRSLHVVHGAYKTAHNKCK